MKLRTVVLLTTGFTLLGVGFSSGLIFVAAQVNAGLLILAAMSIMIMFLVPALELSFGAAWHAQPGDTAARTAFRRADAVLLMLMVAAVVGASAAGISAPAASPYLITVVTVASASTVAATVVARRARRRNAETPVELTPWVAVSPIELSRRIRSMVVTFVVTFVLLLTVVLLAGSLLEIGAAELPQALLFPLTGAFFAVSAVGSVGSFSQSRRAIEVLGGNVTLATRVARVVWRGNVDPLEGEDLVRAARWAAVTAAYLPTQAATMLANLLGGALLQLNVVLFLNDGGLGSLAAIFRTLAVVILIVIAAFIPVLLTLQVRQIRRARAFAQQHRNLLADDPVAS